MEIMAIIAAACAAIFGTPAFVEQVVGFIWRQGRALSAPLQRHLRLRHGRVIVHGLLWAMALLTSIEVWAVLTSGSLEGVAPVRVAVAGIAYIVSLIVMGMLVVTQWNGWARWRHNQNGMIVRFPQWMTENGRVLDVDGNPAEINGQPITLNTDGDPVVNGVMVTAQNELDRLDPHPFPNRPEAILRGFNPDSLRIGTSLLVTALAFLVNGIALIHLGVMSSVRALILLGLADMVMILGPVVMAGKLGESMSTPGGTIHRMTQMVNTAPRAALANVFILCAWVVVFPFPPTMYIVGIVLCTAALTYSVLADRGGGQRVQVWLYNAALVQAIVLVPLSGVVMAWETLPNDGVVGLVKKTLIGLGMEPLNAATGQETYSVPTDTWDIIVPLFIALVICGSVFFIAQQWTTGRAGKALKYVSGGVGLLAILYHGGQLYAYSRGQSTMGMPQYATLTPAPTMAPEELTAVLEENGYVQLRWTEKSEDETGFRIERRTTRTTFEEIGISHANDPNYLDKTAREEGEDYFYRVFAVNKGGSSEPSNVASVKITPRIVTPAEWELLNQPANPPAAAAPSPPPPATEEDVDEAPAKASPTRTSKKSQPTTPRKEYSEAQKKADYALFDEYLSE